MVPSYFLSHESCAGRHEIQRRTQTLGDGVRILRHLDHGSKSSTMELRTVGANRFDLSWASFALRRCLKMESQECQDLTDALA
jgi:hypothetical protein